MVSHNQPALIAFATRWGSKFGGINSFNADLLLAFGVAHRESAKTVCVVLDASHAETQDALSADVLLVSLNDPSRKAFSAELEPLVNSALNDNGVGPWLGERVVWLGHDRITGEIALTSARKRGGRAALIHHMSYQHYEAVAESASIAEDKVLHQRALFSQASVVLSVGPLLRDALMDMLDREDIHMLIPGQPEIEAVNVRKSFSGFLSGRLGDDAAKIKQAHLGVAAFASAIRECTDNKGLPDSLRADKEPALKLRGVDMEATEAANTTNAELELKRFAAQHADRTINLHALPFTTDRNRLFDELRRASVAMMPSWHEGFGLVAWEAIAAGVPLIVSNKSGVHRLLQEWEDGLYQQLVQTIDVRGSVDQPYYHAKDLEALTAAIIQVAKDPQDAQKKAARLRETLASTFTWHRCALDLAVALGWKFAHGPINAETNVIPSADPSDPVAPSRTLLGEPLHAEVEPMHPMLAMPASSWRSGVGLSESTLLRAEEAIVPFDPARQPFLQTQLEWANDSAFPIAVRLLSGAGGMGKTRLAIELCRELALDGWDTGFLQADTSQLSSLTAWMASRARRTCLVIDYAETRQDTILKLVKLCATSALKGPVRVILLARDGGDWWEHLPGKDAACNAILSGRATSGPFALPAMHDSIEARQGAYRLSLSRFAEVLGLPVPGTMPDLQADHFGNPLYVQMAALAELHGERPRSAEGLTRALVNHERRYWSKALDGKNLQQSETKSGQFMALVTLASSITTEREYEHVWQTAGCGSTTEFRMLFRTLLSLYPEKAGLLGLRPDLLGEALVAQEILQRGGGEFLGAVLRHGDTRLRRSALTVISRLLRNRTDIEAVVEDALKDNFVAVIKDLIEVSVATRSTLPQIAERTLAQLPRPVREQVAGITRGHFLHENVALDGLGAVVENILTENARRKYENDRKNQGKQAALASQLRNLAVAYGRCGWFEKAEIAQEEACNLFKGLNGRLAVEMKNELAMALTSYANFLHRTRKHESALTVAKQAVDIMTRLAAADPETHEQEWAQALHAYAVTLNSMGDQIMALTISKQVLDLCERLSEKPNEQSEHARAYALGNHANRLHNIGQFREALDAAREVMNIYERLSQREPGRFEPDLAKSLSAYGRFLHGENQTTHAIAVVERSLGIQVPLARSRPERFGIECAASYQALSAYHYAEGNTKLALENSAQAVEIMENLSKINPERFETDLALALSGRVEMLAVSEDFNLALSFSTRSLGIFSSLADSYPDKFRHDESLADIEIAHTIALVANGQINSALEASARALDTYRRLGEARPQQVEADLLNALETHSSVLCDAGLYVDAITHFQAAQDTTERIARRLPPRHAPYAEESRLWHGYARWLAGGKNETLHDWVLEKFANSGAAAKWRAVDHLRSFLLMCSAPTATMRLNYAEQAARKWEALDPVSMYSARPSHLIVDAVFSAAKPMEIQACRDRLQAFREKRHGNLPAWMATTTDRLGIPL